MVLLDTCHPHYRPEIIRFKSLNQKSSAAGKLSLKRGKLSKVYYSFVLCVLVLICTIKASISNLMSAISFSFVSNDWLSSDPDLMAADPDQGKLAKEHKWTMPGG